MRTTVGIAIHIATIIAYWVICAITLKQEKKVVKIKDVAEEVEWHHYLPLWNTALLVVATILWIVWDVCKLSKVWDKIKEIEL